MTDASATPSGDASAPAAPAAAPRTPRPTPAAPASQPAQNNSTVTGLLAVVAALVILLAAFVLYSVFGPNNGTKIGPNMRAAEAPALAAPPVADKAPVVKLKAKIMCANGTTVEADNGLEGGINIAVAGCDPVKAAPAPCSANCAPRAVVPPCTTCAPRPAFRPAPQVYRPAPQVYRPAPVVQSCYVRVDLTQADRVSPYHKAMPLVVTDQATGRVLGRLTLAGGQNRVAVPCDGGRVICLTLNNQRTEVLAPEWFARNRGNLSQGGVFNSNAPVIFSSRT